MNEAYAFLKECKVFFVITDNNIFAIKKPLMELDDDLIVSIDQDFYRHLNNNKIRIIAIDQVSNKWIKMNSIVMEDFEANISRDLTSEKVIKMEILDYKISNY